MSSTAGICQVCGKHAEKRYGGEGRYLVMCLDCWLAPVAAEDRAETVREYGEERVAELEAEANRG